MSPRSWSPLATRAIEGDGPLRRLAADGLLPLPPEELIALQVELGRHGEPEIAARATQSLSALERKSLAAYIAEWADAEELDWLAGHFTHSDVLLAVIRRRPVSAATLVRLAPAIGDALQEALLTRQDRIHEAPEILDALEANPHLAITSRRRVAEYRRHLVPATRPVDSVAAGHGDEDVAEEASEEELEQAIREARKLPAAQGERDESTGLVEGQVRGLPIKARMRLARSAKGALRQILLRDPHYRVALTVLRTGSLADSEVEQIARSRAVAEEVLEEIAGRREWSRKYPIILALTSNPRTPVAIGIRLLSLLAVRDLRNLTRDRNVSDALRANASRLYMIKTK